MRRPSVALLLTLLLVVLTAWPARSAAEAPPTWEELQKERQTLEENASQALRDEQAVVGELFNLNRTLEDIRASIARLDLQMGEVTRQKEVAEAERDRLEQQRRDRQAQFGRRARYYSENGTFAPIGFLIQANSLSDFLVRIDLLTLMLQRDARLIRELRELKAAVEAQEQVLAAKQTELRKLREQQAVQGQQLETEIGRKEQLLAGLREERGAVESKVAELEQVWVNAARPVLEAFGHSLQTIALKVTDLEPDEVKLSLVPPGATVRVKEQSLNDFIQRAADLQGLSFRLVPGFANLEGSFSGVTVRIVGRFVILNVAAVRYEPQEIQFQGFTLPPRIAAELLASGRLDLDYKDLIGPWSLKEITVTEGVMTLKAGMK